MDEIDIDKLADELIIAYSQPFPPIDSFTRTFEELVRQIRLTKEIMDSIKRIKAHLGKPRKTTYKTIRHDCAKRNGRR